MLVLVNWELLHYMKDFSVLALLPISIIYIFLITIQILFSLWSLFSIGGCGIWIWCSKVHFSWPHIRFYFRKGAFDTEAVIAVICYDLGTAELDVLVFFLCVHALVNFLMVIYDYLFCRFASGIVHRYHSETTWNPWENADVVRDSLAVQSLHIHHWYKRKLRANSLRCHALDSHMFDEGCKLWFSFAICSVYRYLCIKLL